MDNDRDAAASNAGWPSAKSSSSSACCWSASPTCGGAATWTGCAAWPSEAGATAGRAVPRPRRRRTSVLVGAAFTIRRSHRYGLAGRAI